MEIVLRSLWLKQAPAPDATVENETSADLEFSEGKMIKSFRGPSEDARTPWFNNHLNDIIWTDAQTFCQNGKSA